MKAIRFVFIVAAVVALATTLEACKKRDTNPIPPVPKSSESIAWFDGGLDAAFAQAARESKPVFLFWGAEWCPYCADLKANVFTRRDFIEKSRLFVPVYLDGDSAGAQKWAEQFRIAGYPSVLILRPDHTELARISGGMDLHQYADVLDLVLGDELPVSDILAGLDAKGHAALSADECRRLAYNAWTSGDRPEEQAARLAANLREARDLCPPASRIERARLTAFAAAVAAGAEIPAAQMRRYVDDVETLLADPALAASAGDAVKELGAAFFAAAKKAAPDHSSDLLQRWLAAMDAIADDARYTPGDRLAAVRSKLVAAKALDPSGRIPKAQADDALKAQAAALGQHYDAMTRAGVVNSALNIAYTLEDYDRVYDIAEAEMEISKTPYYYMPDLAAAEEKRGHADLAAQWLERGYRESKGAATRFQWGTNYVVGLVRLQPQNDEAIRKAALEVIGELEGENRIYRRTRTRLDTLGSTLSEWNDTGRHAKTIAAVRERMGAICAPIPEGDAAKQSCRDFLARPRSDVT